MSLGSHSNEWCNIFTFEIQTVQLIILCLPKGTIQFLPTVKVCMALGKKKIKKNQLHLTAAMLMSNYATASKLGKLSETQFSDLKTEEHIDS